MQVDLHIAELKVRETFDFGARVQGTALKAGEMHYPISSMQDIIAALPDNGALLSITCTTRYLACCLSKSDHASAQITERRSIRGVCQQCFSQMQGLSSLSMHAGLLRLLADPFRCLRHMHNCRLRCFACRIPGAA